MAYAQTVLTSRGAHLANVMLEDVMSVRKDFSLRMVAATHAHQLFLDAQSVRAELRVQSALVSFCLSRMVFVLVLELVNTRLLIRIQEHAVVNLGII